MRIEVINEGWKFYRDAKSIEELSSSDSIAVNLPHTWNNLDGQDGGADYYRGVCYYAKDVDLNKKDDREYYLEFRGVNSIATVYVNGSKVGVHEGGYSTFRFNVTDKVVKGVNSLVVSVDNSETDYIYPVTADFTFFGGIYRDVCFIEANSSRFDLDYYGSDGVMITPVVEKDNVAKVTVECYLTNARRGETIRIDISKDGEAVESKTIDALTPKVDFIILNPVLWNGRINPAIYKAHIFLMDGEVELDSRVVDFGIRSFSVDKDGFYLNGKKYDLHGVSRHQDRLNKGWAISKADHEEDMSLIKEIGATTIRLAHYQHDSYFYDLCDRAGMVVWAEIPYISVHLQKGDDNAMSQMRELVIQNYNHPSICFWGLSNEITIGGESEAQLELHKRLNDLVHSLDRTRLTTIANVTMCKTDSPLLDVPDIFSYNHYFGWYVGDVDMNAKWIDDFRAKYPTKPLGISEYGAEANLDYHTSDPKRGDYTEEYQALYHETMLKIFSERPYLWSTHVWNMFDFGVDSRDEGGVKGRNNKGLVTYDRKTRKDSFYIYKAYWTDEPFVHICSKRYAKRAEEETVIKVYSNMDKVDLYVGGKLFLSQEGKYVFEFRVPLSLVGTTVKAVAGSCSDTAKFRRVLSPVKSYILEDKTAIHNWFTKDGKKYEYKYPEGKYSIRDTLNEVLLSSEGRVLMSRFMAEAFKGMDGGNSEEFTKNALSLVGDMSIERIAAFAGKKIPEEMLFNMNEELNKINKR